MYDNLTEDKTEPPSCSWDPERYDPDEHPDECLKCGTELHRSGGRATVGAECPECEVMVYVA